MGNMDLLKLTMTQALDGMAQKKFSATQLTQAYIQAVEQTRHLNAYITETPELALQMAKESDARYAKGQQVAMDGLPLGIKDLFCTKGVRTTAGSKILNNFVPQYESTVSGKLRSAGAVFLGKLNLDEFAMGSSNMTSFFGLVKNPWQRSGAPADEILVPGGSSGGSSAAVAARSCMAATGTDTGGSIRQPAAFTGIVGIKPTYGRCSRFGIVAFASSLDQAGAMTRDVADAALMLRTMSGYDPQDATSVNRPVPDYTKAVGKGVKGLRVGIPSDYDVEGMSAEIKQLWLKTADMLKSAGAEIVSVALPHTKHALPVYYTIAPAECSSNLARYDGVRFGHRAKDAKTLEEMYAMTRAEGFGAEVRRRIMVGTYVLSAGYYDAYYAKAQKVRRLISNDFKAAFEKVDVLLTPTAPTAAFATNAVQDDPVVMYLNDIFTIPTSLAGLPGMSLPVGLSSDGLPLGMQLIGRPFDEEMLFTVGHVIEQAAQFQCTPQLMAKVA